MALDSKPRSFYERREWSQLDAISNPLGCWEMSGEGGHTRYWNGEAVVSGHVSFYEKFHGPRPDGQVIHHWCKNPGCVNPRHLEAMTQSEHRRVHRPPPVTHCVHGHEYDAANTYINGSGHRICRACNRNRARERTRRGLV